MDKILEILTYFCLTSIAAERVVDILKRAYFEKKDLNKSVYQVLSAVVGGLIAWYSPPDPSLLKMNEYVLVIVVALVTSGGSSTWRELLLTLTEYRKSISNPKIQTGA